MAPLLLSCSAFVHFHIDYISELKCASSLLCILHICHFRKPQIESERSRRMVENGIMQAIAYLFHSTNNRITHTHSNTNDATTLYVYVLMPNDVGTVVLLRAEPF